MFTTANNLPACSVSQKVIQSTPDNSIRRSYNLLCCCLCQGRQFCAHKAFFAVYLYHHISTKLIRSLLLSPPPRKKKHWIIHCDGQSMLLNFHLWWWTLLTSSEALNQPKSLFIFPCKNSDHCFKWSEVKLSLSVCECNLWGTSIMSDTKSLTLNQPSEADSYLCITVCRVRYQAQNRQFVFANWSKVLERSWLKCHVQEEACVSVRVSHSFNQTQRETHVLLRHLL